MSTLDFAIVALTVVLAVAATIGWFGGYKLAIALYALAIACVAQLWLEGFYWHFVPLYLTLAALAIFVWRRGRSSPRPVLLWADRIGLMALAGIAMIAWTLVPVPELYAPSGPHQVGTQVFRLVDQDRPELATDDPDDRRNVIVQAWYPATVGDGATSPYIDGLGRLPATVSMIPAQVMAHYDHIDTHARMDASVSGDRALWPVVLFSPGYGASRAYYSGLLADLASRGFVVLAVDHPYEAAVVELADGRIATPIERFLADDPDRSKYMSAQQAVRAADLRFVIERIGQKDAFGPLLSDRLDPKRIAAIGHSFGGASAVVVAMSDPRVRAAANLDGTLYGDITSQPMPVPFLLLESDHRETGHSQHYLDGNLALNRHLLAGGYRYEIARANHYSFTDVPLFLGVPARLAATWLIGGSRGPAETIAVSNDLLTEFLRGPLLDSPGNVTAVAARLSDLSGGPQPAITR